MTMVHPQTADRVGAWSRAWRLATVVGAGALVAACGSSASVATSPSQTKCQVALESTASTIGPDGGAGTITVTTSPECPWGVSAAVPWLTGLSPSSGQGSGTVAFRVDPNPLPAARAGDIVVNDNRLRVSQQPAACTLEVQPGSLTIDAAGGTRDLAVTSATGCAWAVTADVGWLSITTATSGSGAGSVGVHIAPNPTDSTRTGTITVGNQRVTVTQAGSGPSACSYAIDLTSDVSVPAAGAIGTVAVTTAEGCTWSAGSSVSWITVIAGAAGSGSGAVAFSVGTNPGAARSGTITVAGYTFTVTQAAAPAACTFTIGAPDASIAASGGPGAVTVSAGAGCAWTATSSVPWITVTSGASGAGPGVVAFSVAANPGGARTAILIVAGQTFTVNQAAAAVPCTYGLSAPDVSIAASGGIGTVGVSTAASCDWSATSNAAWISVTAGGSGPGSGTVAFSVAANTGSARTGTITVAGQTFTVRQAAAAVACTYAINPASAAIAAAGGSGTVDVSAGAGCGWTATSNAAWLTVTSGSTGTGNGPVAFRVAANPGGARTGTITVAGAAFTVTQAATAVSCTYAISPVSTNVDDKGGDRTVTVSTASGCPWTALSNATSWITVTSGTSGTGNGSVQIRVDRNYGAARTGTVTIAGQTFIVAQKRN